MIDTIHSISYQVITRDRERVEYKGGILVDLEGLSAEETATAEMKDVFPFRIAVAVAP